MRFFDLDGQRCKRRRCLIGPDHRRRRWSRNADSTEFSLEITGAGDLVVSQADAFRLLVLATRKTGIQRYVSLEWLRASRTPAPSMSRLSMVRKVGRDTAGGVLTTGSVATRGRHDGSRNSAARTLGQPVIFVSEDWISVVESDAAAVLRQAGVDIARGRIAHALQRGAVKRDLPGQFGDRVAGVSELPEPSG